MNLNIEVAKCYLHEEELKLELPQQLFRDYIICFCLLTMKMTIRKRAIPVMMKILSDKEEDTPDNSSCGEAEDSSNDEQDSASVVRRNK